MRRRLVAAMVGVVAVVLMVLVPPVVVLLQRAATRELEVRLSTQASSISTSIADELLQGAVPTVAQIAQMVPTGDRLVITDSNGGEVLRYGAEISSAVTGTAPGPAGTRISLSTSDTALQRRVRDPLLALAVFVVGSIALGVVLAVLLAGRLTRPLRQLAGAADRLGAGDFSAPVPEPSGIPEVDGIGTALSSSARRLDQLVTAERSFTGDATHQLRTGLTGVSLQLELLAGHADPAVRTGIGRATDQVERLTASLDDLLDVARSGTGRQRTEVDVVALVGHHVDDWHQRARQAGRTLVLRGEATTVLATPGCVGQIIDVLIDNALRHGRGTITVTVGARSVRVADEGTIGTDAAAGLFRSPESPGSAHGRGLVLARRLAQADGGRLDLTSGTPTTFTVAYP